jgi:ethanolamine kinase
LSSLGLSPPLYGRFKNGFAYGFIKGHPLSVADLSDPHKSSLVAKSMAIWHGVNVAGEKGSDLFITLKKWLKEGKVKYITKTNV